MKNFTTLKFIGRSYEGADNVHFAVTVQNGGSRYDLDTTTCFDENGSQSAVCWGCAPDAIGAWALASSLINACGLQGYGDFDREIAINFISGFPNNFEITGADVWNMLNECMHNDVDEDYGYTYNPFEDCDESLEAAQTFQIGEVMALVA